MRTPRASASGKRRPGAGIALAPGRLARLRKEKSWGVDDLAKEAGLSPSMIGKIESQERKPRAATLRAICEALDCRPADLLPAMEEQQETA